MDINGVKKPQRSAFRLLTVLDKMIMSDLLKTIIAVASVIVIIIVSRKFIKILAQAIDGRISGETVMNVLGLKTLVVVTEFLPASVFMAVLMVLGRMYRDQEMAAIASAGGGAGVIYRAVFILILPFSVAAAGLSFFSAPWAEAQIQKMFTADLNSEQMRGVAAGRFNEFSYGDIVLYAEHVDREGRMKEIFVHDRTKSQSSVVNARAGRTEMRSNDMYLVLEKGERVQGQAGRQDYIFEEFEEYGIRLEYHSAQVNFKRESLKTETLWASKSQADQAELQNRFSIPLGIIFLSFLAIPLAKLSPRGGVYGSLLVAFGIYFIYGNLKRIGHSWVAKEVLPVWAGYIWIYLIMLLLGIILFIRLYSWEWIREQVKG